MAASVISYPAATASVYRPLPIVVLRTDPPYNQITEIVEATSGDVATIGNGINTGDILVAFTSTVQGSIPAIAGQTLILDSGCGDYAGVHMILQAFTFGGSNYLRIRSLGFGDYTPPVFGAMAVWLNNYTIHVKVDIYTNPTAAPVSVYLDNQPLLSNGYTYFDVATDIRDYFSHRIEQWSDAIIGSSLAQNAHGVTALFYRLHIAEVYDIPNSTDIQDPFDGTHDVAVDSVHRVAVNAVHPYASGLVDWSSTTLGSFVVGSVNFVRKFLTNAPRTTGFASIELTMHPDDRFRGFMLTDSADSYGVNYTLRVYDRTSGSSVFVASLPVTLTLPSGSAAFSVGVGPADLSPFITVPSIYRVYISNVDEFGLSEFIEVRVDNKCGEGDRPFSFFNRLGGVDSYTFRGRETGQVNTKRATISKPYSTGTGFDFTRRTYRAEPEAEATVSTRPINSKVHKWLANDMGGSSNVVSRHDGRACATILTSDKLPAGTTGPLNKPFVVSYILGVDNLSQQS